MTRSTYDKGELLRLLERVQSADRPERELDAELWLLLTPGATRKQTPVKSTTGLCPDYTIDETRDETGALITVPSFTKSLNCVVGLIERALPGWWWKCGTCHMSDDACMAPDYNSPIHGSRLTREFPLPEPHQEWIDEFGSAHGPFDAGFDTDRRPAGNLPLALLESLLTP